MIRILGIDPGSVTTGYGIIESEGSRLRHIAHGIIRCTSPSTLPQRLGEIYRTIHELIETYQPDHAAIEKVFVKKNVDSALKLGQARGAAICAVNQSMEGMRGSFYEYSPTQIKKTLVGYGRAEKQQMQRMVTTLLGLTVSPQQDAADALSCAICHAHHYGNAALMMANSYQLA
ncbi:MAG: crossover junction endodeoxyribonuclease RuvC [Gammaproteobacteria bacterium]|nr:MAG: crossover junction endodeoxyribonuclease RuvC [Gammaproteobacteria bacterium]